MSAAKRVRRRNGGRRLANGHNASSLKSLLGDGFDISGTKEWFHSSLQSLSEGLRRFNKLGADGNNKKANRCSTWEVPNDNPPTNGYQRVSSFPVFRLTVCPSCFVVRSLNVVSPHNLSLLKKT